MDESKNTVNNDEKLEGMDYSFDFANQVDNSTGVSSSTSDLNVDNKESVNSQVLKNDVETLDSVSNVSDVELKEDNLSIQDENSVLPNIDPAIPVAEEVTEVESDDEPLELIKDKKETKKFLIILFVVILVFIIALPFIFNILG